jgi:hypothetical protein
MRLCTWAAVVLAFFNASWLWAGSINVVVGRELPDARPGAPVKFGVPFPEGTLKVGDAVQVVDDKGNLVVSQSAVLATWDPKGEKGVRWLLVDFPADGDKQYRVVYGKDLIAGKATAAPLAMVNADKSISVETGPLSGVISGKTGDLFSGLKGMDKPVAQPNGQGVFSGFYVEHESKGVFRADLDAGAKVVLEETGPVRATVKMDGWYTNEKGEKFCRYSIRASFYRGRSDVKLEHTFIFTGESHQDKIKSMGLKIAEKTGQRGGVWGEGYQQDDVVRLFTSNIKVVQDSANHDRIELLEYGAKDTAPVRRAGRSVGGLAYGSTAVAIRDAWQQYPWGFEVVEGLIDVQLWPAGERLLDTTFDGYWWYLNELQKKYMIFTKPNAKEGRLEQYREKINATGAAKTHEVWLCFAVDGKAGPGPYGTRLLREVAYPVIACADPAWSTKTRALDYCLHTPKDLVNFGDEERYLDTVLDMVWARTEARHWYGWWDWGSYFQLPGTGDRFPFKYSHGESEWNRNKPKSHYSWGQMAWSQYFRTGERKWLRYGQTYTLYSADRAFIHHTEKSMGRIAGYEYHYDNSDIHWAGGYAGKPGGAAFMNPMADKADYLYEYWLTGDRRAMDVLKMWGEMQNFAGSEYKYKIGLETGGDIRNAGYMLQRVMLLYQGTWDEKYLKGAAQLAQAIGGIQSEEELIASEGDKRGANGWDNWRFHTASAWAHEGLWLYYQATKDERIKNTLLTFAKRSVNYDSGIGWGYGTQRIYAYAYDLTKDEIYLDLTRAMLDDLATKWVGPYAWVTGQKFTTVTIGRSLGMLASAPEAWKAKNLPTNERGRTLRFRYYGFKNSPSSPAAVACFNKAADKAWSFRLLYSHGGKWALYRPDGSVAYESPENEFPFNVKWLQIQLPADGLTGTYTLKCIKPSQWLVDNNDPAYQGEARVIMSSLPVAVSLYPTGPDAKDPVNSSTPVMGRSLFFKAGGPDVQVGVVPAGERPVSLLSQGKEFATTQGKMSDIQGAYRLRVPEALKDKVLEARPDRTNGRLYPDPAVSVWPVVGFWLTESPAWVTANPEEYFVPEPKIGK